MDIRSTHNFLDPKVVKRASLGVTEDDCIKVRIIKGDRICSEARCSGVVIGIQGSQFRVDTYVLTLGGCDVILGVWWLKELSPILWDFLHLTMDFPYMEKYIYLKGFGLRESVWEEGESFVKELRKESMGLML